MRIIFIERQTVNILDEYADRERRKGIIIIHNLSESTEEDLQECYKNNALRRTDELIEQGIL